MLTLANSRSWVVVAATAIAAAISSPVPSAFAGDLDVPLYYDALSKIRELESQSQFDAAAAAVLILERQVKNARPAAPPWVLKEVERRYETLAALRAAPPLQATYAELRTLEIKLRKSKPANEDKIESWLTALAEMVEKVSAVDPAAAARYRATLALTKSYQGDHEAAAAFAEQAVDMVERDLGRPHPFAAKALFALGSARRHLDRIESARTAYESAREEFESCGLQSTADYVDTLTKLGKVARSEKRLDVAKAWFEKAVNIVGDLKTEKAIAESMLYVELAQSGDLYTLAEQLTWVEKAERASQQINPPEPELTASCVHLRGRYLEKLGEPAQAEALLTEAFSQFQKTGNHTFQTAALIELSDIYLKFERYDEAARALESAELCAFKAEAGVLKYVRARRKPVAASLGRTDEMEKLAAEMKTEFPDTPSNRAFDFETRMRLALTSGNHERAVELGRKALAASESAKPGDERETLFVKSETARALQRLGKLEAAAALADEVMRVIEPDLKRRDPQAAFVALKLFPVLRQAGRVVAEGTEREARACLDDKCKFEFKLVR